jgi:PII-like signaling protein
MLNSPIAARLTIQLPGTAVWRHRPAYAEIVHRAKRQGLAGTSVFHGVEGFGADGRIHHEQALRLAAHGPCTVVLVDDEQYLRAFLHGLSDLLELTEASAVLDRVRVYRPRVRRP